MKYNKQFVNSLILFILMSTGISANIYWSQEGGAGSKTVTAYKGQGLYSSYYPTNYPNFSYDMCTISTGSLFEPLAYDFDNDRVQEVVLTLSDRIMFYNVLCEYKSEILLPDTPYMMPSMSNMNENSYQEINIWLDDHVLTYEYDAGSSAWTLLRNVTYLNIVNPNFASCGVYSSSDDPDSNHKCMIWKISGTRLNYTQLEYFTVNGTTVQAFFQSSINSGASLSTLSMGYNKNDVAAVVQEDGKYITYIPHGEMSSGVMSIYKMTFNGQEAVYNFSSLCTLGSYAYAGTRAQKFISVATVKVGTSDLIAFSFGSVQNGGTNTAYCSAVTTKTGTIIKVYDDEGVLAGTNNQSNIMVADYNIDGLNEQCALYNLGFYKTVLYCLDSVGNHISGSPFNFSNTIHSNTMSFVMGDFCNASKTGYLGIASLTGISCYNSSSDNSYWLLKSNISAPGIGPTTPDRTTATLFDPGIIIQLPGTLHPVYVYGGAATTYIFADPLVLSYCDDGTCQMFENSFSCPVDCPVDETTGLASGECISDSDCYATFPKCLEGRCVKGYDANETCADVSDCPYGKPICYYGYCIESVQGGLTNTTVNYTTTITTPDSGNDMMNIWTSLFGNDSSMKLFIGLLFIMIVVIYAHMYTGSVLIDIMVFICSMTIMTFTRLSLIAVNIYILIMLFMAFVIFILYITMRKTGAEG